MSCKWFIEEKPPCPCCERPYEPLRIGISAIGWAFSFDERPDLGLTTKEDWLAYLVGKRIIDEYDKPHTLEEFTEFVQRKAGLRRA